MKKVMILVLTAAAILLCSCGKTLEEEGELVVVPPEGREYDAVGMNSLDIPEIGLHAEIRNITPQMAELFIRNDGTEELEYPQYYTVLELRSIKGKTNTYEVVRDVPYFTLRPFWEDIAYLVWPGSEESQRVRWDEYYGSLDASGSYLLEKEIMSGKDTYRIGIIFTIP